MSHQMIDMGKLEQEGSTNEMVLMASMDANKAIIQVRQEALHKFQKQLVSLRKQRKPTTYCFAIKALLSACRSERSWIDFAFTQIEQDEKFIEEIYRIRAGSPVRALEEIIQ
ncbi:TPA: hypothetical protein F3L22_15200 [Aeromonas hydrophila]|nr:hypothetical protein [Aeromonas hydrophila]